MTQKVRLGELLLKKGIITKKKLYKALLDQKKLKIPLGEMLIRLGYVKEKDIHLVLSDQLGYPYIDLDSSDSLPEVISLIPESKSRTKRVVVLAKNNEVITLAMANPLDVETINEVRFLTACDVTPVIASSRAIQDILDRFYGKSTAKPPQPPKPTFDEMADQLTDSFEFDDEFDDEPLFSLMGDEDTEDLVGDNASPRPDEVKPTPPKPEPEQKPVEEEKVDLEPELEDEEEEAFSDEMLDNALKGEIDVLGEDEIIHEDDILAEDLMPKPPSPPPAIDEDTEFELHGEDEDELPPGLRSDYIKDTEYLAKYNLHASSDEILHSDVDVSVKTDDVVMKAVFHRAIELDCRQVIFIKSSEGNEVRWIKERQIVEEKVYKPAEVRAMLLSVRTKAALLVNQSDRVAFGKFTTLIDKQNYEARVTLVKTLHGETAAIHLTPLSTTSQDLNALGIPENGLNKVMRLISRPKGLVVVTGPPGSGKSSTIYSLIREISRQKWIVSLEDRIRCVLPNVQQIEPGRLPDRQIVEMVRSFVPEVLVIMKPVNMMALFELANITLVIARMDFPTTLDVVTHIRLHISDPLPFSLFLGALAQQRVLRSCQECLEETSVSEESLNLPITLPFKKYPKSKGCSKCHQKGVSGTVPIYELMVGFKELHHLTPNEIVTKNEKYDGWMFKDQALNLIQDGQISLHQATRWLQV